MIEVREDLKRCPFCNGLPETSVQVVQMGGDKNVIEFGVYCTECRISKHAYLTYKENACFTDVEEAMKTALKAWNRRADNGST